MFADMWATNQKNEANIFLLSNGEARKTVAQLPRGGSNYKAIKGDIHATKLTDIR